MRKWIVPAVPALLLLLAAAPHPVTIDPNADIIATERAALDKWGRGDPSGFLYTYADDITYFDPFQPQRIDGIAGMKALVAPMQGKFSIDRYEMLEPKVQRHGDMAVLTYRVVNYKKLADGSEQPQSRWNSTAVFHRQGGRWRSIHSHWSFTTPKLQGLPSP